MDNNLQFLYKISQRILEYSDIKEVLASVLEDLASHLKLLRCMLTMFNRKSGEILIEEAYGLTENEQEKGRYKAGEGIVGTVTATGKPIVVPQISNEPRFLNRTGSRSSEDTAQLSFICIPIKSGAAVTGTLCADRLLDTPAELDSAVTIISIIAMMISQSALRFQLECEEAELVDESRRLSAELKDRYRPSNIIGNSHCIQQVYALIEKIAPAPTTVLILGESGVGKELVANAIHYDSPRAEKPFIKFNCAALPESIIESELFGHEKGAFTGAVSDRKGRFEMANGGSVFIDEIGELSPGMQTKLLRMLQEHEFERVGGTKTIKIDVRVIAATNRDLMQLIAENKFREDLFYRLNVFPVMVPPLRERKTDIPLLADYFIEKFNKKTGKNILRISTPAIDALMQYHWPGNVRELENCIERAEILSDDNVIHLQHLPPTLQTAVSTQTEYKGTLDKMLSSVEYDMLVDALKKNKGNMGKAARELGLTERVMGLRIRTHGIDYKLFRT